jgi:hypothetical protein
LLIKKNRKNRECYIKCTAASHFMISYPLTSATGYVSLCLCCHQNLCRRISSALVSVFVRLLSFYILPSSTCNISSLCKRLSFTPRRVPVRTGEWPPSVVVWSCQHYAVLYGFESRHSPHPSRLLVPNKLMSHCIDAADRKRTPWKCRLMSHEPSSLCQTHHRLSTRIWLD